MRPDLPECFDFVTYKFIAHIINTFGVFFGTLEFVGSHELVVVDTQGTGTVAYHIGSGFCHRDTKVNFLHVPPSVFIQLLSLTHDYTPSFAERKRRILSAYTEFIHELNSYSEEHEDCDELYENICNKLKEKCFE